MPINDMLLPTELWIHILSYLDRGKDLRALTRTSKLLRTLSLLALCRTVDMSSHKRHQWQSPIKLGTRNLLQSPDVAVMVTNLRIYLTLETSTCNGVRTWNQSTCTCARLDDLLGECLLATVNLEVLLFTCRLSCRINMDPRHRYLEQLKTRKLRTFSFYCYCAPHSIAQCKDILAAPCSASIEALHWNAPSNYTETRRDMQIVPNLRALYYQGKPLDAHLLATRPIQRICITSVNLPDKRLENALLFTPGKFTHFSIADVSKLARLIPIKPSLFSNLQHIGTVPGYINSIAVESLLSPFTSLKHLVSIDAVVIGYWAKCPWDGVLLTRLKVWLPKLLRVLCHWTPMSVIWEFKGDSWEKRIVPSFTAWDIIGGVLDNEGGPLFPRIQDSCLLLWNIIRFMPQIFSKIRPVSGSLEAEAAEHYLIAQLPVELWLHILSYIDDKKDLSTLSWTSRLLRALALPLLFQTVDLLVIEPILAKHKHQLQPRFSILKSLRTPGIAAIVIDLRVSISAWLMCEKFSRSLFRNSRKCTCDALDKQVGECVKAMVNLQALHFHCILCKDDTDRRHRYLPDLETCKLRVLSFSCYCTRGATVEALKWISYPAGTMSRVTEKILDAAQTLPCLNALYHSGTNVEDFLLANRPIRRIFAGDMSKATCPGLIRAFSNSPGVLTHIIVHDFSLLVDILAVKPASFANLQHVGTIQVEKMAAVIEGLLLPLQSLNRLTSMDAIAVTADAWDANLLSRLKGLHRNLRRVLVQDERSSVWELRGSHWERRDIKYFSAWDIIRGACDDL